MLGIRQGELDLHGRPRNITWARLAETVNASDTRLHMQVSIQERINCAAVFHWHWSHGVYEAGHVIYTVWTVLLYIYEVRVYILHSCLLTPLPETVSVIFLSLSDPS